MNKIELRKISLEFRTLASQMLKIDSVEEINFLMMFYSFISENILIKSYIDSCFSQKYDFEKIINETDHDNAIELPSSSQKMVSFGYQLIGYILEDRNRLLNIPISLGYTSSRKLTEIIQAFIRKSIEPFIVALRTFLELELINSNEISVEKKESQKKTIFLSYCQKDSEIADLVESKLSGILQNEAVISRDIRDVKYRESFRKFMQTVDKHDYVIMLISDRYLKSRNCMYEMLEVVRNNDYNKKLFFIVLQERDKIYYSNEQVIPIEAKVYDTVSHTNYHMYWKKQGEELESQIKEIDDPVFSLNQAKELQIVKRIQMDLSDFLSYILDAKGLSLSEHISNNFENFLSIVSL